MQGSSSDKRHGSHRTRRGAFLDELRQDVRQAMRQLRGAPGFTAAAVFTLALGIGATTTIFGAVDAVVLRPFAWAHPSRVVLVWERWHDQDGNVSVGNYVDWREQSRSFAALGAEQLSPMNLSDGATAERVYAGRVTSTFFTIFGVRPLIGRVLREGEDETGSTDVAILSYGLWMERFGGSPQVLNRTIRLNDAPVTVIGVMPRGFDPTASGEQIWVPLAFTPAQRAEHDNHYLLVPGLLRPGVTVAQAQADLEPIARALSQRYPQADVGRSIRVELLSNSIIGDQRTRLLTALGAVGFVLLIACGNVANLLLARGTARSQELAIRAALGARSARLVRQLLTESGVLALLAGGAGLALAWLGLKLVIASAPAGVFPRLEDARIDGSVLLFTLVVCAGSALVFGLAPAVRAAGQDMQTTLRSGGRAAGVGRDPLRSTLIITEVALALALLDGAGLLVRSAMHLDRTPLGLDPRGVLTARVTLPSTRYGDAAVLQRAFDRMASTLQHSPGVASAGVTNRVPMGGGGNENGVIPEGRPLTLDNAIESQLYLVSPGYLATLRIPLLSGRAFTDRDAGDAPLVTIVSKSFADRAWPGQDPVGKRLGCCDGRGWKTVIGVVTDVRTGGPTVDVAPEFYLPIAQAPPDAWTWTQRTMTIVLRTAGADAAALTPVLREAVRAVDPTIPIFQVSTMTQVVRSTTAEQRFNTFLLVTLGLVGAVLAGAGIASVVAFFVNTRARDIGLRIAMGATSAGIIRLLVHQTARPLAMGLLAGLIAAAATTRILRGSLYGVTATDPITAVIVVVAIGVVAGVAVLIPARRAVRVDPVRVLSD